MKTVERALLVSAVASLSLLQGLAVSAAPPRDPTQPPAALNAPMSVRQPLEELRFEHIVVVNGVRYLVWNSRRYAAGDVVAGARIERISESAIWLKPLNANGNGTIRKLPLFPSIEKQPLPNSPSAASVTIAKPRTSSSNEIKLDDKNGPKNEK
jgi:hypothetical protein